MGQCCTNQELQGVGDKVQFISFIPGQEREGTAENGLKVAAAEQENVEEINKNSLKEVLIEKLESQWLKEEEVKIQVQEEKKEDFLDFHQFIHLFRRCLHEYRGHDIEEACAIIGEMETLKQSIMEKRGLSELQFKAQVRTIEEKWVLGVESQKFKMDHYDERFSIQLKQELQDLQFYINQLNKAPFIEKSNSDGIKISTRKEEKTIGALIQGQIDLPFENMACIITQIPLFNDFMPFCEEARLMKCPARNNKVGYIVLNPPLVSRREAYFQGVAYFRMKTTKEIFLYTRSIHDRPQIQRTYEVQCPINKDYVQLDYKYFVMRYEPIRQGVGKFKMAINIDNGIHFLPEFIEDYLVREFGRRFYNRLIEICHEFKGSKWQASSKDKPELFQFIKLKIAQLLKQKGKQK